MVSGQNQTFNQSDFQRKTLSADNLHTFGVVRKYMNGAVYVESSPVDLFSKNILNYTPTREVIPLKRVSCFCTAERCCKIHENNSKSQSAKTCDANQEIQTIEASLSDELKISISSLETAATFNENNDKLKQDSYKRWIVKKNEEKKRIEENQMYIKDIEDQEKEKHLAQERENFKRWLANKKREEERRKLEKAKELENEQIKCEVKEKRSLEAKLRYQLWLKKKEQEELEKKIKEQLDIMKKADDRRKRMEENESAFRSWIENSKDKPKPLPPSRGLESLRASASVTYINPIPWTPNIEQEKPKPASH